MAFEEIKTTLDGIGAAFETFKSQNDRRQAALDARMDDLIGRVEEGEARRSTPRAPHGRAATLATRAMESYCRTGNEDELRSLQRKEMGMGSAAAGGALVPEVIDDSIMSKALSLSPLATAVAQVTSATSDYVKLLNLRGQGAAWSAETGTRSSSNTLQLREIRPTGGELYSVVPVTNWLLNDAKFNVLDLIIENAGDQFSKAIENAILLGNGSSQPTGLLNTTPTTGADDGSPQRAAAVLKYVDDTADHADDLISVFFDLKSEYRRNATFLMSSSTLGVIRKLRDSDGSGYLWQQNLSNAIDAPDGFLLGKPVMTSEYLSLIDSSPEPFSILCGDFRQAYELVAVGPMTIIRDDVTVKGKTLFYIAKRVYGHVIDNDAVRALKA